MKVGTDGVLLGAWTPVHLPVAHLPFTVLDVGTGSGLVALMIAQRCPDAHIDAIDIDESAVEQAKENFELSAFSRHLSAFKASLQEWQGEYDLVVSNPPYFQNSLKNPDEGRKAARHTDTLSYTELIKHSARLLREDGQLALILPAEAETEIRQLAAAEDLYLARATRVYSKESKPARRVLLTFSHFPLSHSIVEDTLILEDEKGGRSLPYQELCKEFYL